MEDYKVYLHPQIYGRFHKPTNPFRGGVYAEGRYPAGLGDPRDHYERADRHGLDLTEFVVGLSWSDSISAPYSVASMELKIPDDLHSYFLPGKAPFKVKNFTNPRTYSHQTSELQNFFSKQTKTGAWISIHYPLPVDHTKPDSDKVFYTACFLGKLTDINFSVIADQNTGHNTYTNIALQCESFVQPLIQSQFRVRLVGNDIEEIRNQARQQARSGGPVQGSQSGQYGTSEYIGALPPNNWMGVADWTNYILRPLVEAAGSNKSLGYLFEKFAKLFAAQSVPASVFTPKGDGNPRPGDNKNIADLFVVNYALRHNIGTKWEDYSTSLGQATNFKAIGSAVGKACIWRWLLDTFAVDESLIECFPALVTPKGDSKRQRDESVSRLLRTLVSNSPRSNYSKAVYPQNRLDHLMSTRGESVARADYDEFENAVQRVRTFSSEFTVSNPLPSLNKAIQNIDGALKNFGNPVELNEYDNDIMKAVIIRETYLALGVIPTIFYRLKPLAPGTRITSSFMEMLGVELSPLGKIASIGSAYWGQPNARELEAEFFKTASESVETNEFEEGLVTDRYTGNSVGGQATGPDRLASNYAFLDPNFWLGISFNYSESRRINAVYLDSVFTTGNDTLFDLDALKLVPDPVIDTEDVKMDGFRIYEGSFPFLQTNIDETPIQGDTPEETAKNRTEQMLILPQAMAERVYMLLGKDNEYSSGVITMVYHENWDITPGIYGALPLGNTELPDDYTEETRGEYDVRRERAEQRAIDQEEQEERQWQAENERRRRAGQPELERPVDSVRVVSPRRKGLRLDDESFFEFYIDSVERVLNVDQETGMVSGVINIQYSRGSVGRKQNYFRYHDFGLASLGSGQE